MRVRRRVEIKLATLMYKIAWQRLVCQMNVSQCLTPLVPVTVIRHVHVCCDVDQESKTLLSGRSFAVAGPLIRNMLRCVWCITVREL